REVRTTTPEAGLVDYLRAWVCLEGDDCEEAVALLEGISGPLAEQGVVCGLLELARGRLPGSRRCLRTCERHSASVSEVVFSPDGRLALSGNEDRTIRLWEVSSGRCLRTCEVHTA